MPFPSIPCAATQMARFLLRNRIVPALPRCTAAQQQDAASPGFWPDFYPQGSHLSALHAKPSTDAELIKILGSYLSLSRGGFDDACRGQTAGMVGENAERFPFFEIRDDKGKSIVTLRKRYHGEDIEVTLGTRYQVTGEEHDAMNLAAGGDVKCECENCEDEDCACYCHSSGYESEGEDRLYRVPLTVRVRKGEMSPSLEFICTSTPHFVIIDAVYLKHDPSNWGMRAAYEGPDFNGLNKDLQKAFEEYLDLRGISFYGDYYLLCMLDKACRERRHWLRSMKQFVEK